MRRVSRNRQKPRGTSVVTDSQDTRAPYRANEHGRVDVAAPRRAARVTQLGGARASGSKMPPVLSPGELMRVMVRGCITGSH